MLSVTRGMGVVVSCQNVFDLLCLLMIAVKFSLLTW